MRKMQVGHPLAHRVPHRLEGPHPLALVLDLGIDLGVAPQADAGAEVVHRQQVVFPGRVEELQHQRPLHLSHFGPEALLDGGRPAGARARRGPSRRISSGGSSQSQLALEPVGKRAEPAVVAEPRRRLAVRLGVEQLVEPAFELRPASRRPRAPTARLWSTSSARISCRCLFLRSSSESSTPKRSRAQATSFSRS